MESKELNLQIDQCQTVLKKLAYKFTKDPDEIQDLVQETFLRAIKYVDQFLHNPKIISWLYVIMKNIYINNYRHQQQKMQFNIYQQKENQSMSSHIPFTENTIERKLMLQDIHNVLQDFPVDYFSLFTQFVDGYKYRELSEQYGVPEGTIKSRIHLIRKSLRKKLARYATA